MVLRHEIVALQNQRDTAVRSVNDPAAFEELYDYYLPRIYKYIRYRVGDPQEADELTSRVFERVVINIGSYRKDKGPFNSWIFTIARNILADYMRARMRHRSVSMEMVGQIAGAGDNPEDILIRRERREKLLQAVGKLDDRERDLIGLKFAGQLTNGAISEMTGLSRSNVAVILYRAIQRLRCDLDAMGWNADD